MYFSNLSLTTKEIDLYSCPGTKGVFQQEKSETLRVHFFPFALSFLSVSRYWIKVTESWSAGIKTGYVLRRKPDLAKCYQTILQFLWIKIKLGKMKRKVGSPLLLKNYLAAQSKPRAKWVYKLSGFFFKSRIIKEIFFIFRIIREIAQPILD